MWIDLFSFLCFSLRLTAPRLIFPSWLPIILGNTEGMSQTATWLFLLALPWPPGVSESLNSAPLSSPFGLGSHLEREAEKSGRGLECGSESGGRNASSLFVSICRAWWMRWVDEMTWLIAQTLNKSPILQQASPSGHPPLNPLFVAAASQRRRTLWLRGLEV